MHQQRSRQLQDCVTSLSPHEALDAAVQFFAGSGGVYTAFLEKRGPTHVALRGQGGEELVIGVRAVDGGTAVSGGSYLFDQQIAAFLSSLPPARPVAPAVVAPDAPLLGAGGAS